LDGDMGDPVEAAVGDTGLLLLLAVAMAADWRRDPVGVLAPSIGDEDWRSAKLMRL
jgi:hypothetical protein